MRALRGVLLALAVAAPSAAAPDKLQEAVHKAQEQQRKNQPEAALKTMEKAAAQSPGGAGRLALSRFRAGTGGEENLAAALAAAQQAVQESASGATALKAEALAHLASLELRLAGSKDALAHAEQAVAAAATPETLATLTRVQVRRGRPAGALETADKAVAAGASSAAAWSGKGFALLGLDRPAEAADAFRKALAAEPTRHAARIGLAAALLGLRRASEAEAEARKAVDEKTGDPRDEEGFAVLGLATLAAKPDDAAAWTQAIGEAQNGATVLNPKNPAVKHAVGKIFEHSGDLAQAATNYQAALGADPGFVRARQAMVQVLVWQKKPEEAVTVAKAGVAEDPESADALRLLGQALLGNKAYAQAIPPLEKAAQLSPTHVQVHAALGSAHRLKGQLDKAAASYKRALELAPADTQLRLTYGDLLAALKQQEAAASEYTRVVESAGYADPMGWIKLGSAHRRTVPPRTDPALAAYRKALELDPRNATAAFGLGFAYQASKRYDEAIRAFQEAAKVAPELAADAEVSIAWCYVAKRDADKARIHLINAGRVEPELEQHIFRLARGDKDVPAPGPAPEGPDLAQLTQWIQSRNAATRQRGVRGLCRTGADGLDNLVWVLANEGSWELRGLAVTCLGNIGPAGRDAVPYLRQILRAAPDTGIVATDQQMKDEASLADLKRKAKEALAKIDR